jgi:hypothetical protein
MIAKTSKNGGIYFKLEPGDFKANWKQFLAEVKKMKSHVYNPAELDDDNWWFVGRQDIEALKFLKQEYITKVLNQAAKDKAAGFEPIPRRNTFRRRSLKY